MVDRDALYWPAKTPPHRLAVEIIDEHVISQLPQPLFFTRDDLLEVLHAQLGGVRMADFETAWNRVLAYVTGRKRPI